MAMTLMERDNFRQKMLDEYGPGWEGIVKDYKERSTPRFGPHADYRGMSVNPDNFRTDNPLSLLSSREDIDAVLNKPTRQDYINELDIMAPRRLQAPAPSMEMRTHGVPIISNEIIPYHAESFQNIISPHDPYYYGTAGQIGQMGTPSGGEMPGLLDSGAQYSGLPKGTPFKGIRDKWNEWRSGPGDQPIDSGAQFSQAWPGPSSDFSNRNMNTVGDAKAFGAAYNQPVGPHLNTNNAGWTKDQRMSNANNFRLAGMLFNAGNKLREDNYWDSWD